MYGEGAAPQRRRPWARAGSKRSRRSRLRTSSYIRSPALRTWTT